MIDFTRHILSNGLRVLVHEDHNTPMAAVNVLYDVGSRDEDPNRTGFAHLFEHLMFSGSRNVKDFDEPLQRAGGENNAYTTNDYTTFYEVLPAANLETALWLESDRMLALRINKRALEVQRKVVVEEFKETCLNEPYGDSWHHLSELMFERHPYRWPVIGLTPEHIEQATLEEVRAFYERWYTPANAVLCICGHVDTAEAIQLTEKWFGNIASGERPVRNIAPEPPQTVAKSRVVESPLVPVPAVYLAFRMPDRLSPDFYPIDLLTDILAQGHSSRLYRHLLREQRLFSQVDAYITANTDEGMLIVEGRPADGVSTEKALEAIWKELEALKAAPVPERELAKVQHRFESTVVFSELNVLNKAQNLAFYEILKSAEYLNEEVDVYLKVRPEDLHRCAQQVFRPENSVTLTYLPAKEAVEMA
jgi:zinc protease